MADSNNTEIITQFPQPGKACALDIRGLTRLQALLPT